MKSLLKKKWKMLLLVFAAVFVLCLGGIMLVQKKMLNEDAVKIESGKIIYFDISTYNSLGENIASIYDYVGAWSDEVLLSDCAKKLDETGSMENIVSNWSDKGIESKITWITDNITIRRISGSTMYRISYTVETTTDLKEEALQDVDKMINAYIDYGVAVAQMSDPDLAYEIVRDINVETSLLEGDKGVVDTILKIGIAGILAILVDLTYLGIVIVKSKKKQ